MSVVFAINESSSLVFFVIKSGGKQYRSGGSPIAFLTNWSLTSLTWNCKLKYQLTLQTLSNIYLYIFDLYLFINNTSSRCRATIANSSLFMLTAALAQANCSSRSRTLAFSSKFSCWQLLSSKNKESTIFLKWQLAIWSSSIIILSSFGLLWAVCCDIACELVRLEPDELLDREEVFAFLQRWWCWGVLEWVLVVPPWATNDGTADVLPLGVFIPILWSSISLAVAVKASSPDVVDPAWKDFLVKKIKIYQFDKNELWDRKWQSIFHLRMTTGQSLLDPKLIK